MSQLKCYFIINPISGFANQTAFPELLKKYINPEVFSYEYAFSAYAGHSVILAAEAIRQGFDYIVAVGGDGTINEVASQLVNQPAKLGIIPQGSGNGFARHLGISLLPQKALLQLCEARTVKMDAGCINGKYFFNVSGVGFDGHVSQIFARQQQRGFANYLRIVFNEFQKFPSMTYRYTLNGEWMSGRYFLMAIANTSQYGNNAVIAPKAQPDDGLLDIVCVKKFGLWQFPYISIKSMLGQLESSGYVQTFQTNHLIIECPEEAPVHIDGEYWETEKKLEVKVIPHSLQILAPSR
jgi:diacylglycerol kinase (ATP)